MSHVPNSYHAKVARKACTDIRLMDYLRKVCKSEADFKNMWKLECRKKEDKIQAIKEGLLKSRLNGVTSCNSDELPKQTIRKGRFLITLSPPVVVRKGRFLVTKVFVFNKPEPKKPTVTRKGRFLITSY